MGKRRTRLRALDRLNDLRGIMRQICTDYTHLGGGGRLNDALFLQCLANLADSGNPKPNEEAFLGVMMTMHDKIDAEYRNGWFPTFIPPSRSRLYGLLQPIVDKVPQEKHAECLRQASDFLNQVKDNEVVANYRDKIDGLLASLPFKTKPLVH